MKQHEIKIPSDVDYRVIGTYNNYQPQYKDKKGKWVNFTYIKDLVH